MTFSVVDIIIIVAIAALIIFFSMRRSISNRNKNTHLRFKEKKEELIEMLKSKEKHTNKKENNNG